MRMLPYLFLTLLCAATTLDAQEKKDKAQPVATVRATLSEIADRIEAIGTLRANESVVLTASVTETVSAVYFEDGQRVEKGTVLAELTNTEERAQLLEAQIILDEAKRQYDRIKPLASGGAAPLSTVDEKKREYETALAQVQANESRLNDRLIIAPFSGALGLRNISLGSLVQPGDEISTLDDDSVMKLDFTVPSVFIEQMKVGLKVVANSRELSHKQFEGEVYSVDSRIDPVTRSITVRALVPNKDQMLKPGLLMTVEVLKNPRKAIVVSEAAIIPDGSKSYVYIVESDEQAVTRAVKREVTVGSRTPGNVEITSGLKEQETVIVDGNHLVRPGQVVTLQSSTKDAGLKNKKES